jgi:hypothetical protein
MHILTLSLTLSPAMHLAWMVPCRLRLRVIDPAVETVRTLTLVKRETESTSLPGAVQPVKLMVDSKICIDVAGNIVCVNRAGVHLVTNTGLASGYTAYATV